MQVREYRGLEKSSTLKSTQIKPLASLVSVQLWAIKSIHFSVYKDLYSYDKTLLVGVCVSGNKANFSHLKSNKLCAIVLLL